MRYIIGIGALALAWGTLGSFGGCAPHYPYGPTYGYGYGYDHHEARHEAHERHEQAEHERHEQAEHGGYWY